MTLDYASLLAPADPVGRARRRRAGSPLLAVLSLGWILVSVPPAVRASEGTAPQDQLQQLDKEIQSIKQELLGITEELWSLEEKLIYPIEHRLIVLITFADETPLSLDSVGVALDGETLVRHRYSEGELAALNQGGVHRLYVGTVAKGTHLLHATLAGEGKHGKDFSRESAKKFSKGLGPKYIELRVGTVNDQLIPALTILEW